MSEINLEVKRITKEGKNLCIQYVKDNQAGKYYSETNEIFVFSQLGGVRIFKIAGEYGGEFVAAIINGLKQVEIASPHIVKEELITILEEKRLEAIASK